MVRFGLRTSFAENVKLSMDISFNTKDESNEAQRAAFLKLSHTERFYHWLNMCHKQKQLMQPKPPDNGNFIIHINTEK